MLFTSWYALLRIVVVGVLAYCAVVLLLRVSGKRTLSKMNAFDFIVTVALGSTLATVLVSKDVSLADGVVAFGVLIALQFVVTWSSVRSAYIRKLVKAEPRLLFFRGEFLAAGMRVERVTEEEVRTAARAAGQASMDEVWAVVLETDASFSVLSGPGADDASALKGVRGARGSGLE